MLVVAGVFNGRVHRTCFLKAARCSLAMPSVMSRSGRAASSSKAEAAWWDSRGERSL